MAAPKIYDSNQVFLTIAGRPISKGRASGEFYSSEYNKELNSIVVGADGEPTIVRSNDRSGKVKVKLMQTSSSHATLTSLYGTAINTPGGVLMPYELRDIAGGLLEHGDLVFEKAPPSGYGAEAVEREWAFLTGELIREVA